MSIKSFGQRAVLLAGQLSAALVLSLLACGQAMAIDCRVTTAGTSAGSGTSWASPMDLQTALGATICTNVVVAVGVYKPGSSRFSTFNIRPGVGVYGGYSGNERNLESPQLGAGVTILSGDIDNNDINTDGNNIAETTADIQGGNSYNVVTLDGTQGIPITPLTWLGSFTITGGQANASGGDQQSGGGLYCTGRDGGECSPTVSRITFSGNYARIGGAMYIMAYDGIGNPNLLNVTFSGNSAQIDGGAMYSNGLAGTSSPVLSNVTFSNNSAGLSGGAMNNYGSAGTSLPILSNVTFSGNSASLGGAMFNDGSSPSLNYVTFSGNSASNSGGAMYNLASFDGDSSPTLNSVILWGDTAPSGSEIYNSSGTATPVIDTSVVQGGCPSGSSCTGLLTTDPKLGPLGNHGSWTATMLLGAGSSAIDAGNYAVCAGPIVNSRDQRGIQRPQGAVFACDIGAVEMTAADDTIFINGFDS